MSVAARRAQALADGEPDTDFGIGVGQAWTERVRTACLQILEAGERQRRRH